MGENLSSFASVDGQHDILKKISTGTETYVMYHHLLVVHSVPHRTKELKFICHLYSKRHLGARK